MKHTPVLLTEILTFFKDVPLQTYVDGTTGAGGHALAILENHPELQTFFAFDRDESALEIARETLAPFKEHVQFIHSTFDRLDEYVEAMDGMLLDVGVSSMQLDQPERGFSFYKGGPLDMRMDQSARLTAKEVVNRYGEKELMRIIRDYGEERRWRQAARAIVEGRQKKRIETTEDLVNVLGPVLGWKRKHMHPATLVFQAIRIEVNQELKQLENGIETAIRLLNPGGRLGVISFHSLEDRIVKQRFRKAAVEEKNVEILTKKPVTALREEQLRNPRARSAKLRF